MSDYLSQDSNNPYQPPQSSLSVEQERKARVHFLDRERRDRFSVLLLESLEPYS